MSSTPMMCGGRDPRRRGTAVIILHSGGPSRQYVAQSGRRGGVPNEGPSGQGVEFAPEYLQSFVAIMSRRIMARTLRAGSVVSPSLGQVPAAVRATEGAPLNECLFAIEKNEPVIEIVFSRVETLASSSSSPVLLPASDCPDKGELLEVLCVVVAGKATMLLPAASFLRAMRLTIGFGP